MLLATMVNLMVGNPVFSSPLSGNLSSRTAASTAGTLPGFSPVNVHVGNSTLHVTAGTLLTPAELLAVQQVLVTGHQSLILGKMGNAISGSVAVGSSVTFSDLVVPKGVTLLDQLRGGAQTLTVQGVLQNAGHLTVANSLSSSLSALIGADSIQNQVSGIISAGRNINLTLSAMQGITNAGSIRSSGNLNLTTPQLINTGLIQSTSGNVTIAAPAGELDITGSGTINADQGDIVLAAQSSTVTPSITLVGGNYFSQQLNIDVVGGNLSGYVGKVTGLVNIGAANSDFGAATPVLRFGTQNITGDPTYFNTNGSLVLSNISPTHGADLALLASGDVIVNAGTIDTTIAGIGNTGTGNGGNVLIVAGAQLQASPVQPGNNQVTNDNTTIVSFSAPSQTGGAINLKGVSQVNTTGTSDGHSGVDGGGVTMLAFAKLGSTISKLVPGSINLGSAAINTYGNGGPVGGPGLGTGGTVTIIAGAIADPKGGHAIAGTGLIETGGTPQLGSYVGGPINISTAAPVIAGGSVVVIGGTIQSGSGTISAGTTQKTSMSLGSLDTSPGSPISTVSGPTSAMPPPSAANITLTAGTTITAGSILAFGLFAPANETGAAGAGGAGGNVDISAGGNIKILNIGTPGGDGVTGTGAGGVGGNGGNVTVVSSGGTIKISTPPNGGIITSGGTGGEGATGTAGGAGGNAGSVTLTAPKGAITVEAIEASGGGGTGGSGGTTGGAGGAGGAGGNVTLTGKTITVTGYISAPGGGGGGAGGQDPSSAGGGGGGGSTYNAGDGGNSSSTAAGGGGGAGGFVPGGGGMSGSNLPTIASNAATLTGGTGANGTPGAGGPGNVFSDGGAGGSGGDAGGAGGAIGQAGSADTNSTVAGGAAGAGGVVSLTGNTVAVKQTFYTFYKPYTVFNANSNQTPLSNAALLAAPHFFNSGGPGDSILTAGPGGGVIVQSLGTKTKLKSRQYAADGNLLSTLKDATLKLSVSGPIFNVGHASSNGTAGIIEAIDTGVTNPNLMNAVASAATIASGQKFPNTGQLTIIEGGSPVSFINGQSTTPAELIALIQVGAGGKSVQTLSLDATGVANIQGTFTLAKQNLPATGFTTLNIPELVTCTAAVPKITVAPASSAPGLDDGIATFAGLVNFKASGTISAWAINGGPGISGISLNAAKSLTLNASHGYIALAQASLNPMSISTSALIATASGNVVLTNTLPSTKATKLTLNASFAKGSFTLANNGSITVHGGLAAVGVSLDATELNSSITLSSNVMSPSAPTLLTVIGTGTITQPSGTLDTSSLVVNAGTGNVTLGQTGKTHGLLLANQLQLMTVGPTATVSIQDGVAVRLNSSSVAGNLTLSDLLGITALDNTTSTFSGATTTITTSALNVGASTLVTATGALAIQSPIGQNLAITGTGTIADTNGMTLASSSGSISFASTIANEGVTLSASAGKTILFNANNGSFAIDSSTTVTIGAGANASVNTNAVFDPNGLSATGTETFTIAPKSPTLGTISSAGDINLTSNMIIKSAGKNLAVIAGGNITGTSLKTINLSNRTGNGGNLTLLAGFDLQSSTYTPTHGPSISILTSPTPSPTGGNVNLAKISLNTGSTFKGGGSGGNVLIVAGQGTTSPSPNMGEVFTGAINSSSSSGSGGNVEIIAPGGITVNGAINAKGAVTGGTVTQMTATPNFNSDFAVANGFLSPLSRVTASLATSGSGPAVTVNGAISANATSTFGVAGGVTLGALSNVQVNSKITTTGFVGGAVNLTSIEGVVNTTSNIATNGIVVGSAGVAGSGGAVNVNTPAFSTIGGNILTNGASAKGTSISGTAGNVTLITSQDDNSVGAYTGDIMVKGFINAFGGNQLGTGYGIGGAAGAVTITAGALQVLGTTTISKNKFSINNNIGNGTFASGAISAVTLTSYSVQQLPSNFNLTSATQNIVALPGGLITFGLKPVNNGTAGYIYNGAFIADGVADQSLPLGPGPAPYDFPIPASLTNPNPIPSIVINVLTTNSAAPNTGAQNIIEQDGSGGYKTVPVVPGQLITPAMAVALYQTSLTSTSGNPGNTNSQTLGLSSTGLAVSVTPQAPHTAQSSIVVPGYDLPQTFSSFILAASDIANSVSINVTGVYPVLNLAATKAPAVSGTVNFSNATTGLVNLGSLAFTLPAGATITSADNIAFQGTGKWTNSGTITAPGDLYILDPGKVVSFTNMGPAAGAVNVADIFIPATGAPTTLNITNNQGTFSNIGFGALQLPTSFGTSATALSPGSPQAAAVTLNLSMSGTGKTQQTATLDGMIPSGTIGKLTILGKPNAANSTLPTPIDLNGANYTVTKGLTVSSGGLVSIDGDSSLQAGLPGTDGNAPPVNGVLVPNNIVSKGSITIQSGSTKTAGGITTDATGASSLTTYGGNLTFSAIGPGTAGISMTNTNFSANGGNLVLLTPGKVSGSGDNYVSNAVKHLPTSKSAVGGGIEIGAGATAGKLAAAIRLKSGTAPDPTRLGTGVSINNGSATHGVVKVNLSNGGTVTLNTALLDVTLGGAIVFDSIGAANTINLSNVNFTTAALKPIAHSEPAAGSIELIVDADEDGL